MKIGINQLEWFVAMCDRGSEETAICVHVQESTGKSLAVSIKPQWILGIDEARKLLAEAKVQKKEIMVINETETLNQQRNRSCPMTEQLAADRLQALLETHYKQAQEFRDQGLIDAVGYAIETLREKRQSESDEADTMVAASSAECFGQYLSRVWGDYDAD